MKIGIVVPVKRGSIRGNEVTAIRWKSILEDLNHDVEICTTEDSPPAVDCLIAIHAINSNATVCGFRTGNPEKPIIVCLSGTDLHGVFDAENEIENLDGADPDPIGMPTNEGRLKAEESLRLANAILLLEPNGIGKLPKYLHPKCHVIFQSADVVDRAVPGESDSKSFQISVIGHLRHQKDPMLAARAIRKLPPESRIQLVHVGEILEQRYDDEVQHEIKTNPRYSWTGKLDHESTLKVLVESDLSVLTSIHEGAPSIVSEAIVNGIPILATRIDATEGMLGSNHPGLFDVGDAYELSRLMLRAEQDAEFMNRLKESNRQNQRKFTREAETENWRKLISILEKQI